MTAKLTKHYDRIDFRPVGLICLAAVLAWFTDSGPVLRLLLVLVALGAVLSLSSVGRKLQHNLLLGTLVVAILIVGVKDDIARLADGEVRIWNVYHYYLGAKYFDELGYTDLYAASLVADREAANYWTEKIRRVRDLETYEIKKVSEVIASYAPDEHFSPDRWSEFKADVNALGQHSNASEWRGIFRDRGYNATPVWTTLGGLLASAIPADSAGLMLLCSLDLLFLVLVAVCIKRAFGIELALLVFLLFVASPTNVARAAGGFLQFDWLFAIVASVCLLKSGRPGLGGIAISYSIMTRAFPALLVISFCLPALISFVAHRRIDADVLRYVAGVSIGCAVLALVSLGNGHGVNGWYEFVDAISLHGGDHVLGERRVGLEHVFTADFSIFGTETDKVARAAILSSNQLLFSISSVLLLGLWCAAIWRSVPADAMLLGVIALFAVMVLSRYYFAILALLPLLSSPHRRVTLCIVIGQLAVFLGYRIADVMGFDRHAEYVVFNAMLACYFSALLVWLLASQRSRLRDTKHATQLANEASPGCLSVRDSALNKAYLTCARYLGQFQQRLRLNHRISETNASD